MSTASAMARKWRVDAFLRRPVVVRHDREGAIGADLERVARELDRLGGGVAAGAGHHRDPAGRVLDRDPDHLAMLLDAHRRRFAGGADDADALRALGDVPVDEATQRVEIDAAVFVHRRDERDDAAGDGFHGWGGWLNPSILATRHRCPPRVQGRSGDAEAGRPRGAHARRRSVARTGRGRSGSRLRMPRPADPPRGSEVHRGRAESRAGTAGRRSRCRRRRSRRGARRRFRPRRRSPGTAAARGSWSPPRRRSGGRRAARVRPRCRRPAVSAMPPSAAIASASRSTAVTAKPWPASQRLCRPPPAARSRTRPPGGMRWAQRSSQGEAAPPG